MKFNKKIFFLLVFSTLFLSSCSLSTNINTKRILKNNSNEKIISQEKTEDQKLLENKWIELKNSEKFLQCYQSKKDFDRKKEEILPLYKEVLNKEIASKTISFEDEYIKYIHDIFEIAKEYERFDKIQKSETPENEENLIKIQELLEYIYCPDVKKINFVYPLTTEGCIEILSVLKSNDRITGIPDSSSYQIKEEYILAKKKFMDGVSFDKKTARECCISKERSISCTKVVYYLEGNNY